MAAPRYRLGVDVGGTFTDFVLLEESTGALYREKCLTTPQDPVAGIMEGIARLRAAGVGQAGEISAVAHATTLVTNTLIERKGARTALLATEGFRDLLELGSDMRYDMYDLAIEFPPPLVQRPHRYGVRERVAASGESLIQPQRAQVSRHVADMKRAGIQSVAVSFLHSYRNPDHERAVGAFLRALFPAADVSLSSAVAPEIREYERTVTVVANAYVKPALRSYLDRLTGALRDEQVRAPILVMLSNGGMTTPNNAAQSPIRMVESGPAAGVLSACHAGARIAEPDLLGFDMGGTTAKACFIDNGKPAFTGMFEAARVKRQFRGSGMPLKVPSVEMIEIGAGGGSIARVDATGLLKVGPDSAGADPGPVCYAGGGHQPTVTDADLVLGYLDPSFFLGGDMPLDLPGARRAIERLGAACGLDTMRAAAGIVEVVNQNMATAVRIHAAERGKDYRRYALFAFGGAGPVHAYELARILRLKRVICPLGAGTNSAFGLLTAPVAIDLSRSYHAPLRSLDWSRLNALYQDMESEARRMLADAGIRRPALIRTADMRFVGQGFELALPVPRGKLGPASAKPLRAAFHAAYRKVYDAIPGDLPMEAITWRLRACGPDPKVRWVDRSRRPAKGGRPSRPVYFPEARGYLEAKVHDRYALRCGRTIQGPAIVEERESTAVIGPRARARIDTDLNLVIDMQH